MICNNPGGRNPIAGPERGRTDSEGKSGTSVLLPTLLQTLYRGVTKLKSSLKKKNLAYEGKILDIFYWRKLEAVKNAEELARSSKHDRES